nr:reverse transcriptase domain-containing protein [Tanacetum cinerariifolium]
MTAVPRHIAEHRLNVREGCSSVRQKKRRQADDRNQTIQEEVRKLVKAGIMREVHYHDWLSNPVTLSATGNRPEGGILVRIPFQMLLDAYKGYHQIKIAKEDEERTAFIISQEIFCYTKMPFGLWNDGATYQRLVDLVFHKQIGGNLEVYVDDLVIKSCTEDEIVRDIEETFKTPREINMKLNPKKCTFGVEEGMFLGAYCLLGHSKRDREYAIYYKPRVSVKGQILADFIVKRPEEDSSDTLMEEEEELLKPWILFMDRSSCTDGSGAGLILTNPEGMDFTYALRFGFYTTNNEAEYEALIVRLRIAEQMGVRNLQANVDSCLVANQVNETYVAKEADMIRYLEKVKALTGSFKAFSIKQIHRSEKKKSRCSKQNSFRKFCALKVSVKGQILADFIVKRPEEDSSDTLMEEEEELLKPWILFMDRSSCTDGSGAGLILTNPEGMDFTYALRFGFDTTNNEAEYEALIVRLRIAEQMGVRNLQENVDSRLVANQVNETYVAKEADMIHYLEKVKALTGSFKAFSIKQIHMSEKKSRCSKQNSFRKFCALK